MVSVFKTDKRFFWLEADGGGCKTPAHCFVHRFYCPRFERCVDESVPVSHSSFRTRKTDLLLTPVA